MHFKFQCDHRYLHLPQLKFHRSDITFDIAIGENKYGHQNTILPITLVFQLDIAVCDSITQISSELIGFVPR